VLKWAASAHAANKGRTFTDEHCAKLRAARAGKRPTLGVKHTAEARANMAAARRGMKRSAATRAAMSVGQHRRHGTVPDPARPTKRELGRWAYEVIKRDHATCQVCGFVKDRPKSVNAHHTLSKALWPALALNVSNGITLCAPCHTGHHALNGIV
jgi:hypothetical protein